MTTEAETRMKAEERMKTIEATMMKMNEIVNWTTGWQKRRTKTG